MLWNFRLPNFVGIVVNKPSQSLSLCHSTPTKQRYDEPVVAVFELDPRAGSTEGISVETVELQETERERGIL